MSAALDIERYEVKANDGAENLKMVLRRLGGQLALVAELQVDVDRWRADVENCNVQLPPDKRIDLAPMYEAAGVPL